MSKHYLGRTARLLLAASTISGITLLSTLAADANTLPSAGTKIENQATAEFTDEATNTSSSIVSDKVTVTVAEVAGISKGNTVLSAGSFSRTETVNFEFKIVNTGNDPTKFYIPGILSAATYKDGSGNVQTIPANGIGTFSLVAYNADGTSNNEVAISGTSSNPNTIPAVGISTGDILGLTTNASIANNQGSIKPGGYVVVRVPVTIPYEAKNEADSIVVTLGKTTSSPQDNQNYTQDLVSANSTDAYDLYTKDNSDNTGGASDITGEANGAPSNGTNGVKEASITLKATVIEPDKVTISGTVYDDRDNTGATTDANTTVGDNGGMTQSDTSELGTDGVFGTGTVKVRAVLVNKTTGKVIDSTEVADGSDSTKPKGSYKFTDVPGYTDVKVILDKVGRNANDPDPSIQAPATNALPATWVQTAGIVRTFRTGITASTKKDFGIRQKGKLILLKRITKVGTTTMGDDATDTKNGTDLNGTGTNWPSGFIKGKVDAGQVQPGEAIEYTIYFLNNQGADVTKARICDQIKGVQTYEAESMTLGVWDGTSVAPNSRTDSSGDTDKAQTFAAGATVADCNLIPNSTSTTATDPGVLVDIAGSGTKIPGAKPDSTGAATYPNGSYGYFRFTTKANGTTP